MCGINGIVNLTAAAPPVDRGELLATRDAMTARGPDDAGAWIADDRRVGLASRRLAILDLSPAGAQPMAAAAGRVRIVFNGEIFNFRHLRGTLGAAGAGLAGGDTEVVLALYLQHGERCLPLLRGMFALAVWDGRDAAAPVLLLARDGYGIKPLYYSHDAARGQLRFASQVKALAAGGAVAREVDPAGLAGFLLWGSVPEPATLWRAVRCLPAGHCLRVTAGRVEAPRPFGGGGQDPFGGCGQDPFGGGQDPFDRGGPDPFGGGAEDPALPAGGGLDAAAAAGAALDDSIAAHLVSDVPVAVFLSAGLDSALVAALARRHAKAGPLTTITLGFDLLAGTPRDEAPLAAEVARRLGTRHQQIAMGRADFIALWPAALAAMDQPSIDGFNTFVISRAAHQAGFKVVLSGLGGDELFGSYPSFRDVPRGARLARWGRRLPGLAAAWPALARRAAPGRPKLAGLLRYGASLAGSYYLRRGLFLPEELPGLVGRDVAAAGLAHYDPLADGERLLAAAAAAAAGLESGAASTGWRLTTTGAGAQPAGGPPPPLRGDRRRPLDPWLAVHLLESGLYMRNQLLRDADWASMAWSVELRVPLVDLRLRRALAAHGFQPARREGKAALVRRLAPELPDELWRRPKSGFYIPVLEWLRPGALGPAAQNLGARSRVLARLILADFGIHLDTPAEPPAS